MLLNPNTKIQQEKLADYCRTGEYTPLEGVTPNRVHHYRRLIFNIALDTLSTAYPITKKLLGSESWKEIVEKFYSESECTTPYVWRMPLDFYEFVKSNQSLNELMQRHPFILDLIYFEWIELEMYMMEDIPQDSGKPNGDLKKDVLVLNPESKVLLLDFPVHRLAPEEITSNHKGKYYCLCFREPIDRKIQFIDLSAYYAFLIENLYAGNAVEDVIAHAAEDMSLPIEKIEENTMPFIEHLRSSGFVLGFNP
jgi:hypothetical protein